MNIDIHCNGRIFEDPMVFIVDVEFRFGNSMRSQRNREEEREREGGGRREPIEGSSKSENFDFQVRCV